MNEEYYDETLIGQATSTAADHTMFNYNRYVEYMRDVHEAKNHDYSPDEESFGNFKESEKISIRDYVGAFIRLQDKLTRVRKLLSIPRDAHKVVDEKLEDTLVDLANYCLIVSTLIAAKNSDKTKDEIFKDLLLCMKTTPGKEFLEQHSKIESMETVYELICSDMNFSLREGMPIEEQDLDYIINTQQKLQELAMLSIYMICRKKEESQI